MEKSQSVPETDFRTGFYIELNCCMCNHEQTYAADTKEELQDILNSEGWKELDSDEYQLIGHHCGCDYRD